MRYKSCTTDDINFLHTRISGTEANQPVLAQKKFCNVSIITAWNSHKDQINKLGSLRFARETFYIIMKQLLLGGRHQSDLMRNLFLDTLFVKLSDPPKVIQIVGLPQNVVPITRCSTKTVCKLLE
jgi:hypothetical protein